VRGKFGIVAGLSAVSLLAAACGSSSGSSGTSPSSSASSSAPAVAAKFKACMVTDTGGIDDKSFNQSSYQGLTEAAAADPNVSPQFLPSTTTADYASNITSFIGQKCGIIVTVGFLMGAATSKGATANPGTKFAIVDFPQAGLTPTPEKNVDALTFNTVQDGFLGGYLAAGMTKSKKVATFGGQKFSTVTIYMDGFWDGVQYYNSQHHTNVQVLGWNEKTQKGSFTGNFTDLTAGQRLTTTFISEGADIIFPVAGGVGLGAMKAIQNADSAAGTQKVNAMWVDTDGCVNAAQFCKYFITSVEKGIQTAVKNAVLSAAKGTFQGGNYVGTLANGGVGLAPYHTFGSKVPAALTAALAKVKAGIENGSIKTPTKSPV
jgi:basic membrane protein A and related proteins